MISRQQNFVSKAWCDGDVQAEWGKYNKVSIDTEQRKGRTLLTVARDISVLVFNDSEKRGPLDEVIEVEVNIVVFRQRVEVGEVGIEKVFRLKSTEGGHD